MQHGMENYPVLFSPARIGRMTVKNRAVMAPMGTHSADPDGNCNEASVAMYAERARGGAGMIIVGMMTVDEEHGQALTNQFRLRPEFLVSYARLTEEVHAYGTKIIGQLYHGGAMCDPSITGSVNFAPSDMEIWPGRPARAMTADEIAHLRQQYVEKALLLQKAGFDGAEIHAAHGYLLAEFLSPFHNRRTDGYGGSFENRFRLLREIVCDVRAAVGPRFALLVRYPGDEFARHLSPLHMTEEDGLRIARALEETGAVDALDVSYGNAFNANANCEPYSYETGWKKGPARRIRAAVSLPVIATNTIKGPEAAEALLEEGVSDFVAIGRGMLADPFFMQKAWEGREDEIRRCMGCMHCRSGMASVGLQCAVNPRQLREASHSAEKMKKNGAGRRVAVVGGGPGGLECAKTLAERGFAVTLYEKENETGGSMNAADKAPHKEAMGRMIGTMTLQAKRAGVRILTGTEATAERIAGDPEGTPEAVFLAAGARPIVPPIPGVHGDNVHIAEHVLRSGIRLSGRVAVIGGGMTGMETAETLEMQGCEVTLIEMAPAVGAGMAPQLVQDVLGRMPKTRILTRHRLTAIEDGAVTCETAARGAGDAQGRNGEDPTVRIEADAVVLALGASPDPDLAGPYIERFGTQSVLLIGDAEKPGRIYDTVKDGFLKGWSYGR